MNSNEIPFPLPTEPKPLTPIAIPVPSKVIPIPIPIPPQPTIPIAVPKHKK